MLQNKEIIRQVGHIYEWLDEQLNANNVKAGVCGICGKCCDFESYDHRLYVTTPEMIYFADKLTGSDVIASAAKQSHTERSAEPVSETLTKNKMPTGRCPYQVNGKCTVYPYRFAACRIFCCKADADFQSDLTETAVKKFKMLCEKFQIPYRYVDLPTALKSVVTAEHARLGEASRSRAEKNTK